VGLAPQRQSLWTFFKGGFGSTFSKGGKGGTFLKVDIYDKTF